MALPKLETLLRNRNPKSKDEIELLVLSACETAAGDQRAALGLAGVAVRAGARSTLASLWKADDEVTARLISEFYRKLYQSGANPNKAIALQDAQRTVNYRKLGRRIRSQGYQHERGCPMRMSYQELKDKPRTLQSLTGVNPAEFEALLEPFGKAWEEYVDETFKQTTRRRAYGAGRKAELEALADKLLFILVYFRLYPTQEVQGYLFGLGQAQANEWVHRLTRVLNQALGQQQHLPEREPAKLEAVLSACPSLEFIIDGTERPINRPKDQEDRKTYYSGKQKQHTVKNDVIVQRGGRVVFLSDTDEGKKHDKKIADEERTSFLKGVPGGRTRGFRAMPQKG